MVRKYLPISVRKTMALVLGLGLIGLSLSGTMLAQRSDKETIVTFSLPVEIPGSRPQVLPAGTYLFKIVDNKSEPHIVQVSNKDESKIYSTILSIPAHRDVATNKTVMTFQERAAGQPQALREWFYPNDTSGEEFVYPKMTQPLLAQASPAPQPTVAPASAPAPAPPTVVESQRTETVVAQTPAPPRAETAQPAPTPAPPAAIAQAPTPAAESTPQAAPPPQAPEPPARLPQTASNLPTLLLVGLLSVGVGLTVRRLSSHR